MALSSVTHRPPSTLSVGIALFLVFFHSAVTAQSDRRTRPALVVAEPVVFQPIENRVEAVGTAEARHSVVIFPAVAERVTGIYFAPGQQVKKGDLLLQQDDRRQRVAVKRAEINLRDAERTVQRLQDSRQRGAVPQSELDIAMTQRDLAKVALQEAEVELSDRVILAPFDGTLGLTDVEVGDRITAQTAITTLDDRGELLINFSAPEQALSFLLKQGEVTLVPWLGEMQPLNAPVVEVDSRVDNQDRSVRARALLANAGDQFRPGMSFRVNLSLRGASYAVIPEAALSWDAVGAYIWVSRGDKAERVDVQVKQRQKGVILVDGAVEAGELLITEGVQRLRAGQPLTYDKGLS